MALPFDSLPKPAKLPASNLMMHPILGDCKSKRVFSWVGTTVERLPATMGTMSGWSDSVTPIAPPTSAHPGVRTMAYAAAVTGGWSGLVCLVLYGLARLLGVPMEVETAAGVAVVPWFSVLLLPLIAAEIGAIASLIVRGRRGAGRIVFWGGTLIAIASFLPVVVQPEDVLWSTRIWLGVMHVVTWILVVPQIARIVGDSEPGKHEEREVIYT